MTSGVHEQRSHQKPALRLGFKQIEEGQIVLMRVARITGLAASRQ